MKNLHILSCQDIVNNDTIEKFNNVICGKKTLFICANKSTKELIIRDTALISKNNTSLSLYSDIEFSSVLTNKVFKNSHYLSSMDCKYILLKQIEIQFKDDAKKLNVFKNIYNKLYSLYSFMMFNDLELDNETLKKIALDFPGLENDIFSLYVGYTAFVKNTVEAVKNAKQPPLENLIRQSTKPDKNFDTFQNKIKKELENFCIENNVIILNGFLFFDHYYKYLINKSLEKENDVYLMLKESKDKKLNEEIFNKHYFKVINENINHKFQNHESKNNLDTALNYLKNIYPKVIQYDKELKNNDNSIEIIKPFPDRESELRFVIKDISNYLKKNSKDEFLKLKTLLNEIAIIISVKKNQYEQRIELILQDIGIFIYKNNESAINEFFGKQVQTEILKNVYYERNDFLSQDIKFIDNVSLSYKEKNDLFKIAYKGLSINKTERPIASYPVGQFIVQLYNILLNGMSVYGFKTLLFSNWQFHTKVNSNKWENYLGEFKLIEVYFDNITDIFEWINTINKLIDAKNMIEDNDIFKYHPLSKIDGKSLSFIHDILNYLQQLTEGISRIKGGLDEHLKYLKNNVIHIDNLINISEDNLTFEQKIIKKLYDTVENVNMNSIIGNLDAKYFAENIRNILNDFDDTVEEDIEGLKLNIIKLVNAKKYRKVYFVMLEFGKYPRVYNKELFPYTKNIIKILDDKKYNLSCVPSDYYSLEYHLKVEPYLFLNVLDFTKDKLIITMCESEYGYKHLPSCFLKDILYIFKDKIEQTNYRLDNDGSLLFKDLIKSHYMNKRENYELIDITKFLLCPKLYYHIKISKSLSYTSKFQLQFYFSAVLYCDTIERFKQYNLDNKKIYTVNDDESQQTIMSLFEKSWEFCEKVFFLFSNYEKQDIKNNAEAKVKEFIPNILEHSVKGKRYTVIGGGTKKYNGDNYNLLMNFDTKVFSYDIKQTRVSQERIFLDFLVLKTNDKENFITHYRDMVQSLEENKWGCDRVNLIVKVIGKINRQFASERFAYQGKDCGIDRINKLVYQINKFDFSKTIPKTSDYCSYCSMNDVCMSIYEDKGVSNNDYSN